MHVLGTGKLMWYISNGATNSYIISDTIVNDNNWHFVSASFKSGELIVYIDGVKKSASTSLSSINTAVIPFKVGSGAGSNNFNGLIDEVKVWNYALTDAEIKNEYDAGNICTNE